MKAAVLRGVGDLRLEELPDPKPKANEVLIRVRASGVCGTDVHMWEGKNNEGTFPFIPGHEWSGEIAALGPGAERYGWKVGDRIAGSSHDACGVCQKCVEGRYNLCENYGVPGLHKQYGHNVQGAYATYVVQGVKTIFRLPEKLSFEDAALLDPAAIGLHVARRGNVQPGDTVAVTGAGPIGILAGDAARALGAGRVIMIERVAGRLAKAAELGFETIDSSSGDPVTTVRSMTGGLGPDVVLECAGVPVTMQWALAMLRRGGRCAAVGIPTVGTELALQRLVLDELELVGCRAVAGEMGRVIPLVEKGRIRVHELVTHRFPLSEYGKALETFTNPTSGAVKVVVIP